MTAAACELLLFDQTSGVWQPCGKPAQPHPVAGWTPNPLVCARHRRELAHLTAAGLAAQVRFATDHPPTLPGAGAGDAQTALTIPEPAPRPYPWQTAHTTRPARPAGGAR